MAQQFDTELFGLLVRRARRRCGLATFDDFSAAIAEATEIEISPSAIQRIESGKQEPKISQVMAMSLTLGRLSDAFPGNGYFCGLESEIDLAAPDRMREIKDANEAARTQQMIDAMGL